MLITSSNRITAETMSVNVRSTLLILLLVIYQLLSSSCSRKIYPEASFSNIGDKAEKRELQAFMDGGTEKAIDTHGVTPDDIVITARKYLGVPHCMGGTSMKCIDCSGLLVAVFAGHGIKLPHSSEEQARYGRIITDMGKLQKGDLVFFIRSYRTSRFITHSGIYVGDGRFIHTSGSKGVIITAVDDPWWSERYLFSTRIFE